MKKIGIIGGAGPLAGALLFQKIIKILQNTYHCHLDADFPYIFLLNYPFSDLLHSPDRAIVQKQLKEAFDLLKDNKVEIAAIACNTLHEFLEEELSVPIVHLIAQTGNYLKNNSLPPPLVLCSTTSAECKLHQKYFPCTYPIPSDQEKIQDLIDDILTGQHIYDDVLAFIALLNKHKDQTNILLGCTEFSLLFEEFPFHKHGLDSHFTVVDPNEIVARELCIAFKGRS